MEYNAKTRIGILGCFLLMLLILVLISIAAIKNGKEDGRQNNRDGDAVYVGAVPDAWETLPPTETTLYTPQETTDSAKTSLDTTTQEAVDTTDTTGTSAQDQNVSAKPEPLYYATVSKGKIVLLDRHGNYLYTLNEHAAFLPASDVQALQRGIALYSEEELAMLRQDLG